MNDIKKIIQDIHTFHGLSAQECEILLQKMEIKDYKAHTVLFEEGEMGKELYMILDGRVQVYKVDAQGVEHTLMELDRGHAFGEMSLIDIQPRAAAIRTLQDCSLAILSYNALFDLFQENMPLFTKIVLNLARDLSRRLRRMDAIYVEYSQVSPDHLHSFNQRFEPPEIGDK